MPCMKAKVIKPTDGPWPKFPINTGWIQEGTPDSRGAVSLESCDSVACSGQWSCTPCKFRWEYEVDEFVFLLEGEVVITEEGGESFTLTAGDMMYCPRGLVTTWEVVKPTRKVFFCYNPAAK